VNAPSASADGFSAKLCGNPLAYRLTDSSCREVCPHQHDLRGGDIAIENAPALTAVHPLGECLALDRAALGARLACSARIDQLQRAVESMHSCRATLAQTVPVREEFQSEPVWEGVVHVFDVEGHPTATRAYAWSSSIEGSERRRFFAVLALGAIQSPVDAVRAAIVAEQRAKAGRISHE
jgi:hypothetical protein